MLDSKKIWLKQYPEGVTAEIKWDKYANLDEMLRAATRSFADQPAFENMGETMSYAEVDRKVEQCAAFFQQSLGLKKGGRIALQMPNLLQYPIVLFGALRAGLVVVSVNPLYTAYEMHEQLEDAEVDAIVILENFADKLEAVLRKGLSRTPQVVITRIGDLSRPLKAMLIRIVLKHVKKMIPSYSIPEAIYLRKALQIGATLRCHAPEMKPDDLAFLQYTGGTTGTIKAAMLSHSNVLANVAQIASWVKQIIPGKETIITALPLYHILAMTGNCLFMFHLGAKNVLITNPRDMKGFLKTLRGTRMSFITGVNTLFRGMMNHPDFDRIDFSALKISLGGGMALQKPVTEEWERRTGCPLVEGYGLSETSPVLTLNPMNGQHKLGSIGLPIPQTDIRIIDDQNHDAALGEVGEICAKGPQVMSGYWRKKQEIEESFFEGYLRTGDLAKMDENGFLYIIDRKKDMVNVSGLKAYPNQIEEVIAMHPKVLEVGVRGASDPQTGEAVHAFVVKKDATLSKEELIEYCKQHLAAYKIPKQIYFKKELPKSNVGKILRRKLEA